MSASQSGDQVSRPVVQSDRNSAVTLTAQQQGNLTRTDTLSETASRGSRRSIPASTLATQAEPTGNCCELPMSCLIAGETTTAQLSGQSLSFLVAAQALQWPGDHELVIARRVEEFHAEPLSPLRSRDLVELIGLFQQANMGEIEADLQRYLSLLCPEPCWEEDPLEFLREFL